MVCFLLCGTRRLAADREIHQIHPLEGREKPRVLDVLDTLKKKTRGDLLKLPA